MMVKQAGLEEDKARERSMFIMAKVREFVGQLMSVQTSNCLFYVVEGTGKWLHANNADDLFNRYVERGRLVNLRVHGKGSSKELKVAHNLKVDDYKLNDARRKAIEVNFGDGEVTVQNLMHKAWVKWARRGVQEMMKKQGRTGDIDEVNIGSTFAEEVNEV